MTEYVETAFAKVNLALHVRARRADGYHELDSLFAFVDGGDIVRVQSCDIIKLTIGGPFAGQLPDDDENLVLQTARKMAAHFKIDRGADLHLEKNLPVASGIGGGSADAAATARLLVRFWGLDIDDDQLAEFMAPLGADIPACVISQTVRGRGTGVKLERMENPVLRGCPILLVNPGIPVSTAEIFGLWDGSDTGPLPVGDDGVMANLGKNSLEPIVANLHPQILDIINDLHGLGAYLARMSGSGATVFGLFDTAELAQKAQSVFAGSHPEYWTFLGNIR